jgi:polyhydroxyalkanoate synthesis regulator phasin
MMNKAERQILDMVEEGQLSAEEGLRLINAMGGEHKSVHESSDAEEQKKRVMKIATGDVEETWTSRISEEEKQRMNRLKRWWILPFGIGLVITTLGTIWMYLSYVEHGFSFGFWLAWIPLLLGIFIVAVTFRTNRSLWLHVRIKQKPGETPQRISISLPMPIALTRWFFRTFGDHIPELNEQVHGNYSAILDNLSPEDPFYVHVNEDDGDEVEVFIG